jgi:hypothetical protein
MYRFASSVVALANLIGTCAFQVEAALFTVAAMELKSSAEVSPSNAAEMIAKIILRAEYV